jgi:hypothetical protein
MRSLALLAARGPPVLTPQILAESFADDDEDEDGSEVRC